MSDFDKKKSSVNNNENYNKKVDIQTMIFMRFRIL